MSCPYAPPSVRVEVHDRIVLVEPGTPTLALPTPPRHVGAATVVRHYDLRPWSAVRCPLGHYHATEAIADLARYEVIS